jgi:hypothetical protein
MIQRKINDGITRQRDSIATARSGRTITTTTTQTWVGPHALLALKQAASEKYCTGTSLTPSAADGGTLTLVIETSYEIPEEEAALPDPVIEVIWQELRLPVMQHPAFATITPERRKEIRKLAETEGAEPPDVLLELYLYNLLAGGTTEYATGVPVVRRTTAKRNGDVGGGNAWFRDTPPVDVAGGWEWMKTADERRHDGTTYSQVEEWTGAEDWDSVLYPGT